MPANVAWKWRVERSQPATGSSMSKSSPLEASDEWGHAAPHNSVECEKKEPAVHQVNHAVLQVVQPEQVIVEMCRSEELDRRRGLTSELDEMWSYVYSKACPRWLWHAIGAP